MKDGYFRLIDEEKLKRLENKFINMVWEANELGYLSYVDWDKQLEAIIQQAFNVGMAIADKMIADFMTYSVIEHKGKYLTVNEQNLDWYLKTHGKKYLRKAELYSYFYIQNVVLKRVRM